MRILGLTNRLPKGLALFFYEYDDTPLFLVEDEAKFLSQAFEVDIYLLQSSKDSYHLVSLDILPAKTVESMQNWVTIAGNYMTLSESPLFGREAEYCVLRVGSKGKKSPPKFLSLYKAGDRPKSLQHYAFYRGLGVPEIDPKQLVNLAGEYSIYNGGIGARPKKTNIEQLSKSKRVCRPFFP